MMTYIFSTIYFVSILIFTAIQNTIFVILIIFLLHFYRPEKIFRLFNGF